MKRIISKFLINNLSRKRMHHFYEALFNLSLSGMNYGGGGNYKNSGELNVLRYIKKTYDKKDSLVLFDVGGNEGNYSKTLAEYFNKNTIIHSFEPSKQTFERFLNTTSGITNIIPNNYGFGDTESCVSLYSNNEATGLASVYNRNLKHFGISLDQCEEIKLLTIDNYCKQNNISRIHFLKLDIEGHELKALKGAEHMINNGKIDFIQFEFGGCNIDSRTYFQDFFYFFKDKYRIYRVLKNDLIEISQYKETHEIFITVNYLAERIK